MSIEPKSTGLAKAATRSINRAEIVDGNFIQFVQGWADEAPRPDLGAPVRRGHALTGRDFLELFESQMLSRHQDIEARAMSASNEGFYTIGRSGHEIYAV